MDGRKTDTPSLDPSASVALAGFVAGLDLANVPDDIVAYARVLLLDLLGAALAGVDTAEARAMLSAAEGFAPNAGPCAIWGTSRTTTAAAAALTWMFAEWITHGKPSALGIASGVVAGAPAWQG